MVNNHTYKFARRAQSEGIALIDYPDTILKCSNKVYIAELLQLTNLATPKSMIIHQSNKNEVLKTLGLPCVLKSPDSTFSLGVKKVETIQELKQEMKLMLEESDMILGQQYMFTEFDWRIGILDNKVIFACKYYMAKGHWQIYNWKARSKKDIMGLFENLPVEHVPPAIIKSALKAVAMVYNDGLFGVDIKEVNGKPYIIEINDNPNIDAGVEDQILKDELYMAIMQSLKNRIEEKIFNGNRKVLQAV
jgi:glutathione synthase/RimK-type ligase-like ATP-grasp enzyme